MMLIDLRSKNITGKDAENALGAAGITVNKNMVPFDDKSPFVTSGIRVGTAAMTSRGMKENEMKNIVHLIDKAISNFQNKATLRAIKKEAQSLMKNYPLY